MRPSRKALLKGGSSTPVLYFLAPVSLVWTTATTVTNPSFSVDLTMALVGDTLTLDVYSNAGLTTLYVTQTSTLSSGDITSGTKNFTLGAFADGTYYAVLTHSRTGAVPSVSSPVTVTIAAAAFVLSSPTTTSITSSTATAGVTTSGANGTLYRVTTLTSSAPSALQVENGQDASGATLAANLKASSAISSSGAKTQSITGLAVYTDHWNWWMHKSATGTRSAVTGDTFKTLDTVATLTNPLATGLTTTTATVRVDVDKASGTVYYIIQPTAVTAPTSMQIKQGLKGDGTTATSSDLLAISSSGTKSFSVTGLAAGTGYKVYFTHENTAGLATAVTYSFTTVSAYSQTRVTFDGTNDWISYTSNTSIADSTGVTISFWATAGVNTSTLAIIYHGGASGTRVQLQRNSSNKLTWQFVNSSGVSLWTGTSTVNWLIADGLVHYAISFDASTGTGQLYRNGVSESFTSSVGPTTGTIQWARNAQASGLFASTTGTSKFNGTVGDLWVDNAFINLSSNINTFWGSGTPPDLTGVGSPEIWLGKDMTVTNWNNLATTGQRGSATMTMTMNGAVT